MRNTTSQRRAT